MVIINGIQLNLPIHARIILAMRNLIEDKRKKDRLGLGNRVAWLTSCLNRNEESKSI
jgi:hypothetical protein